MGPARTSCVQQTPTYSTTTTLKRMHSTTPGGRTISRSVLVAVVDCSKNDGVLIGGTCNTFLKSGTEDDIGVEPLSMVAIVPFDSKQPATTGFVECRARIPDNVEPEDLDWDIEAVAECCLDKGDPSGGEWWDDSSSSSRGGGSRGAGGRGSGSNGGSWSNQSPRSGGSGSPSLTVIRNPAVAPTPPSVGVRPAPAQTPAAAAPGTADGLDPGQEEIEFDPGADGTGAAWGSAPTATAPTIPNSNWQGLSSQQSGAAAGAGWQAHSSKAPGAPQAGVQSPAGQGLGGTESDAPGLQQQEEEEDDATQDALTASVPASTQAGTAVWTQPQPQQQQQQQQQQKQQPAAGTARVKPAPVGKTQGATGGAAGPGEEQIPAAVCHQPCLPVPLLQQATNTRLTNTMHCIPHTHTTCQTQSTCLHVTALQAIPQA
jgi:hypothetical protein